MDDPSHSVTTAPSAPSPASFNGDYRIICPFLSNTRKPCIQRTEKIFYIGSGHRRQSLPGNPVIVGTVQLAGFEECKPPFCVTGNTDDEDNVTLTIQGRDEQGRSIPVSEEILQKAMKKAQGLTQTDIMRNLEVTSWLWKQMVEDNTGEHYVAHPSVRENPLIIRDQYFHLFMDTILKHVIQTISHQRAMERERFLIMLRKPNGLAEVYKLCGWTDLAERKDLAKIDPVKLVEEYEESCINKLGMGELPMQLM